MARFGKYAPMVYGTCGWREVDSPTKQTKSNVTRKPVWHCKATCRTQLGEAVFAYVWDEGKALSLEQAIDLALTK